MRVQPGLILLLCLLAFVGCGKKKSTDDLIKDLKSGNEKEKINAVRTLPAKGEAAKVVPALIKSLTDRDGHIRRSAAIKLGEYGAEAKDAVPELEKRLNDGDARVREAAGLALTRIDPEKFPATSHAANSKAE
jgi:HEAT repeat protein